MQVDEESAPALMMAADLLLMERVTISISVTIVAIVIFNRIVVYYWILRSLWSCSFCSAGEVNSGTVLAEDHLQ